MVAVSGLLLAVLVLLVTLPPVALTRLALRHHTLEGSLAAIGRQTAATGTIVNRR